LPPRWGVLYHGDMPVRRVRLAVSFLAGAAWLVHVAALPAAAQVPGLPPSPARPVDAIERARSMATAPRPTLGPAPQPAERWVPERRITVPGTARQIVIPGHTERVLSNTQVVVPTLPVYGAPPGAPTHIYRHDAPPAEIRQGP
jgi:hypothetical protein